MEREIGAEVGQFARDGGTTPRPESRIRMRVPFTGSVAVHDTSIAHPAMDQDLGSVVQLGT